jgi:integrase/recombinase XerD
MTTLTLADLSRDIEGFLQFKRALGHPYEREQYRLRSFERFVREHSGTKSKFSLEDMLGGWLARVEGRKAVNALLELRVIRQLCRYRRRRDPHGFVPDRGWTQPRKRTFLPHIFTREQVLQLLDGAERPPGQNIGAAMFRTLMLVLYCTGLRLGEAVRLQLKDVDLERKLFVVRESKGKTRIVPFRSDLASQINAYLCERERVAQAVDAGAGALFLRLDGSPLTVHAASLAIRRLLRREGLKPPKGRVGPRPYDLRHAFAVARLTEWYRKGLDIHARLPWLSAYMGHDNILGTEVYLHATSELMQLASQRFEARLDLKQRRR